MTSTFRIKCSEINLTLMGGLSLKVDDIGKMAKCSKLVFETKKGSIEFINLNKLEELFQCPVCGKNVTKINDYTIELECDCEGKRYQVR